MARKIIFLLLATVFIMACRKDNIDTSSGISLRFSTDTVTFDTVFTDVGSITKRLKVFNPSKDRIRISDIRLAGGDNSNYRINVDGINDTQVSDVEILGEDSIYVFVEVTVDPNDLNNPLIVRDSIFFNTNGNSQNVKLIAWGQDAYVHSPNEEDFLIFADQDGNPVDTFYFHAVTENERWDNVKPHLVYGTVIVLNGATLTIDPGTNVHLASNSNILVEQNGSLQALGTVDNPINICGDRLDEFYKDLPGQWGRIWLTQDSRNNRFQHTHIKNGTTGIYLGGLGLLSDGLDLNANPDLFMENTIVTNMIRHGLLLQSAEATIQNSEVSDCGENNVWMYIGGDYKFTHCTMANYFGSRQTPMLRMSNFVDIEENNVVVETFMKDLNATFENSIIYGSNQNEMIHEINPAASFDYYFDNCLMKLDADEFDLDDTSLFTGLTLNENPKFIMTYQARESNYQLDTLSIAKDIANPSISTALPTDLLGASRLSDLGPDLGCYERVE